MLDWASIGTAATAIGGLAGLYFKFRKGISSTVQQHNQELQALAETRREEIEDLTSRLATVENERDGLTSLYERSLEAIRNYSNEALRLRGEADTLRDDNLNLRRRVASLESSLRTGDAK